MSRNLNINTAGTLGHVQQQKAMEVIRRLTRAVRDPFYDKKFHEIAKDENVLRLNMDEFVKLIGKDSFREEVAEKEIFALALKWLTYQKGRSQHMYPVFSNVRFYTIPKDEIKYCAALCKEFLGDSKQFTELITYAKIRDSPTIKIQQKEPEFCNFSIIEERQEITLAEKGLDINITDTWDPIKHVGNTFYVDNDL